MHISYYIIISTVISPVVGKNLPYNKQHIFRAQNAGIKLYAKYKK
jgi:hypothetical protein